MGKMLLIEEKPEDVETVKDLFRSFKNPLNQLILNQNELCRESVETRAVALEANQRSKTNRWILGIILAGLGSSPIIIWGLSHFS